ncbi:MAG: chemotaxis protein CheW [Gammaproteobacteria bacterium]|nr:chemotaxis protein CheW [Gammaproteobacteria bacterium]
MDAPEMQQEAAEWQSPSAALNRFEPPEGTLFEASQGAKARTRYGCQIGTIHLLIGMNTVSEVMPLPVLAPVPNTPPWLKGLLNLRGNLVPVFDLKLLLELEEQESAGKAMALILDKGELAVGIIVDGFPRPLTALRSVQHLPELPRRLHAYVSAGYMQDDVLWLEFGHEQFFDSLTGTHNDNP